MDKDHEHGHEKSLQLFEKPNVLIKYTIEYIHVYCGDMWSIWRQEFEHSSILNLIMLINSWRCLTSAISYCASRVSP